jgi:hypothetical protein
MRGDREMDDAPTFVCEGSTKTKSTRPVTVGTVKKSIETTAAI